MFEHHAGRSLPSVLAVLAVQLLAAGAAIAVAQDDEPRGLLIQDNAFLIEEAFNQDQGIVQHIFNWVPTWDRRGSFRNDFAFVFTQEWPMGSKTHQFSYTLPMLYTYEELAEGTAVQGQGFGDMLLSYRLQALDGQYGGWLAAPRFSVILPTGDEADGLGTGQTGYEFNLPLSHEFDTWALHLNAGYRIIPGASSGTSGNGLPEVKHDLESPFLGAGAFYVLRDDFHLMLETVAIWSEEILEDNTKDPGFTFLLSPGFRWAAYTEGDTQWVLGAALPIGLTRDSPDLSLFLYMSFEHRIRAGLEEN